MPLLSAHSTSQGDPHRLRRAESAQRDAGPFAPFWNSLSHGCPNRVLRSVPAFHPGSAERIPRLSGHVREKQRHPPSENEQASLEGAFASAQALSVNDMIRPFALSQPISVYTETCSIGISPRRLPTLRNTGCHSKRLQLSLVIRTL